MQNEFWEKSRVGRVNEDFSFIGQTRLAPQNEHGPDGDVQDQIQNIHKIPSANRFLFLLLISANSTAAPPANVSANVIYPDGAPHIARTEPAIRSAASMPNAAFRQRGRARIAINSVTGMEVLNSSVPTA